MKTHDEIKNLLISFGYNFSSYKAGSMCFHHYSFTRIIDNKIHRADVGYVIDEYGILRQQFDQTHNLVKFQTRDDKTSGYWGDYSFEKCIELIIDGGFANIDSIREYKLGELGI